MKSNFYFFCIVIAVFFGCESPNTNSTLENSDLALATVDSIRVDYIGTLNLMDVNPEFEMVLLFDPQKMQFISADFDGNILAQFSKERDAPDGFGFYPMAAGKFNASKNIQIVSASGIFEYDIAGNLLNSTKVPRDEIKPFSGRADAKMEVHFVNDKILLAGLVARGEYNKTQPEFYDTFLQLVWADPETGNYEQFLNLDPESIFQNNRSHEPSTLSTSFDVVDDQLLVISGIDPFLNSYKLDSPYTRVKRIPLELKDYRLNQGEDPKKADPRMITYDPSFGIIHKLVRVGNKLVLTYETGYSEQDALSYHENKSDAEREEFDVHIAEKYKLRYQILDLDGKLLTDSEIPGGLSNMFVSRGGELWFLGKTNPELEEDFYKLYEVRIK